MSTVRFADNGSVFERFIPQPDGRVRVTSPGLPLASSVVLPATQAASLLRSRQGNPTFQVEA